MERINELEEKIVNEYVVSILKQVNDKLSTVKIDLPFNIKTRAMNTIAQHIRTSGSDDLIFYVCGTDIEKELKEITKGTAIKLFLEKLDKQSP